MLQSEPPGDSALIPQLPVLKSLPQWSRVNDLDKHQKPFLRDRLQPLPRVNSSNGDMDDRGEMQSNDTSIISPSADQTSDQTRHIQQLESSIKFLQKQHRDLLASLHNEIEQLKKQNKELQFRLIMEHQSSATVTFSSAAVDHNFGADYIQVSQGPTVDIGHQQPTNASYEIQQEEQTRLKKLEEELNGLKMTLAQERQRNDSLSLALESAESARPSEKSAENIASSTPLPGGQTLDINVLNSTQKTCMDRLPFSYTLHPLLIYQSQGIARPPTFQECQMIIQYLETENERQAHELRSLKSDLRDVLYSHKWTPEAYLMAKAYVTADEAQERTNQQSPLAVRGRKPSYYHGELISLSPMKLALGNRAVERQKRTQLMQKTKLSKQMSD